MHPGVNVVKMSWEIPGVLASLRCRCSTFLNTHTAMVQLVAGVMCILG